MDSPLLTAPGAVPADPPDEGVAAHYGEPYAEQVALSRGDALTDRSNRGVIRISGPDRLRWLHSLTSQHLTGLKPQQSAEALLLSPHGHIEHHLALIDDGEAVWAHVEPGTAADLVNFLDSMRFTLRVEVSDESGSYAVVSGAAPLAGSPLRLSGSDWLVEREKLPGIATPGLRLAGMWAYEALRIAAHVPRPGLDTDHRTIPHEAGMIPGAVHLDKGCYRGQETVARVHNLGRPPRRLVMLHLDGSVDRLPAQGDLVELDGRKVGVTGSAARHHELGPIALALVKRNVAPEAELTAGGVAAAQEIIVSPDTGANAKISLRSRS